MLPDVGIDGEVCIQRALKLANVTWAVRMSWHTPPSFYNLFIGWGFHAASYVIGGTIPNSLLVLVENIFTPLV